MSRQIVIANEVKQSCLYAGKVSDCFVAKASRNGTLVNAFVSKCLIMALALILTAGVELLFADWTTNLQQSYWLRAGFSGPVVLTNVQYVVNIGGETLNFDLSTTEVIISTDTGYEFAPDLSWITASPSTFTLTGSQTQIATIRIEVPYEPAYLGKKYEIFFRARACVSGDTVGTYILTKFLLTIDNQAILLTFDGETPVTKIGMLGNKLIVNSKLVNTDSATTGYRKEGETTYTTISSAKAPVIVPDGITSKKYTFEIPASAVKEPGLEYYIKSSSGYYPSATQDSPSFDGRPYKIDITRTSTGTIHAKSAGSVIVPDGNSEDGQTQVSAPKGAVPQYLNVSITQLDADSAGPAPRMSLSDNPAAIFDFSPTPLKFSKPVDLTMLYLDLDKNGIVDNITDADGEYTVDASSLKLFFWDGFEWRVAGASTVNKNNHTVTCKVDHFSKFALFPAPLLSPEDYRPKKKIITPNDDLINDDADFNALDEEIKIYDIAGEKVRTVAKGVGKWDGKDDNGKVVESGTYIYQYKVDGKLISGVIVVAK